METEDQMLKNCSPDGGPLGGLPLGLSAAAVRADAPLDDERVLLHDEAEAPVVHRHQQRAAHVAGGVLRNLEMTHEIDPNFDGYELRTRHKKLMRGKLEQNITRFKLM